MPRPTNKIDLLNASEANFKKLLSLVESMSEAQQEAKFDFENRDKCVRDVLAHLYEWHLLLINFIQKKLKRRADCVFTRAVQLENLPADERTNLAQAPRYAALRS